MASGEERAFTRPPSVAAARSLHCEGDRDGDFHEAGENPSRAAANCNRSSKLMKTPVAGIPAHSSAAANCNASAARNGCRRSNRSACSRSAVPGCTSYQLRWSTKSVSRAERSSWSLRSASRCRRAIADAHSMAEPHHTTISRSFARAARDSAVRGCARQSGTIADESQNLTSPRRAR